MTFSLSRRALIAASGLGLSLSFLGAEAQASADPDLSKRKMVVVLCRGGADGLSITAPVGDPNYEALRKNVALSPDKVLKVDETFGLHPALTSTHALALKGQARFAPAIASPDRSHSHFEAQDVLELGVAQTRDASTGWLNRALGEMAKSQKIQGLAVGSNSPLILRGKFQTASWSPGKGVDQTDYLPTLLQDVYKNDPVLGPTFAAGLETEAMAQMAMKNLAPPAKVMPVSSSPQDAGMVMNASSTSPMAGSMAGSMPGSATTTNQAQGRGAARKLSMMLAKIMLEKNGPRIAVLSLDGWDTHSGQLGVVATRLSSLDAVLEGLNVGLGSEWSNTVVVVATEFGRTARVNGTGGTDHGTGATAFVLGGGLKPGGIIGDWPTLKETALLDNRDLAPSLDIRGVFKGVLADHMGLDRPAVESVVFPDSAAIRPVTGLV